MKAEYANFYVLHRNRHIVLLAPFQFRISVFLFCITRPMVLLLISRAQRDQQRIVYDFNNKKSRNSFGVIVGCASALLCFAIINVTAASPFMESMTRKEDELNERFRRE